jgi:hypothetical protein
MIDVIIIVIVYISFIYLIFEMKINFFISRYLSINF